MLELSFALYDAIYTHVMICSRAEIREIRYVYGEEKKGERVSVKKNVMSEVWVTLRREGCKAILGLLSGNRE